MTGTIRNPNQAFGLPDVPDGDQTWVAKAGDTMTGPLVLPGDATSPLQAATKQQAEAAAALVVKHRPVLATDYGFLPSATAAANDTAIANALATGRVVYVPGFRTAGVIDPYHISVPINATAGRRGLVGDFGSTRIIQDTDTAACIRIGGELGVLDGFEFMHQAQPTATQGDGIHLEGPVYWNVRNVRVFQAGIPLKQQSSSAFSNQFDNLQLVRYWTSALKFGGVVGGYNTGNCWNNIYTHNAEGGVAQTCAGPAIDLSEQDESVFNQLNIEWCKPQQYALLANGVRATLFNSLHIEQVHMSIWDSRYVEAYGNTKAIINGMSITYCDVAPTGAALGGRSLLSVGAGATLTVPAVNAEGNSNTLGEPARVGKTDADAASRLRVGDVRADIFTAASTGAGLRQLGEPILPQKAGAFTTTDLPYSGMQGLDTTNNRLYVNVAGVMKSVLLG